MKSDALEDLVSERPSAVLRYGNYLLVGVFMLLVGMLFVIRYPEIVDAKVKLASVNPPKALVSQSSGTIIRLLVSENHEVCKNQVLAFLESTADHEEVMALLNRLQTADKLLREGKLEEATPLFDIATTRLGELQSAYESLQLAYLTFNSYNTLGFYSRKRHLLLQDQENLRRLHKNLLAQQSLHEIDLKLAERTFNATQKLNADSVVSDFDFRNEQSRLIAKQISAPQMHSALILNESQQISKTREILELETAIEQHTLIFREALNTFRSQGDEWQRVHLLVSPVDGRVVFANLLYESQYVEPGEILCYVNPHDTEYFAHLVVSQFNLGRVAMGQQVMMRLESYPFEEFGYLVGRIEYINEIPTPEGYLARVRLLNGLTTNYRKAIMYRDGLAGSAQIVTADMSLIERFYLKSIGRLRISGL